MPDTTSNGVVGHPLGAPHDERECSTCADRVAAARQGPAPNAHFVYADDDPDRIDVKCGVCGDVIVVPNKGLGRAMVAVFRTQHQHRNGARNV